MGHSYKWTQVVLLPSHSLVLWSVSLVQPQVSLLQLQAQQVSLGAYWFLLLLALAEGFWGLSCSQYAVVWGVALEGEANGHLVGMFLQ